LPSIRRPRGEYGASAAHRCSPRADSACTPRRCQP
jgi:hypothetical protein